MRGRPWRFLSLGILALAAFLAVTFAASAGSDQIQGSSLTRQDSNIEPPVSGSAPVHLTRSLSTDRDDDANDDDAQPAITHTAHASGTLQFDAWVFDYTAEGRAKPSHSSPTRGPPAIL